MIYNHYPMGMCIDAHPLFSGGKRLSVVVKENETIEDLQLKGLKLIQSKDDFRFGMDSVLLAHFADIRPDDTVADLGTGNGVLIFLLYGRNKGKKYYAIDIQQKAAELARRNAELNHLDDQITVINTNAHDASEYIRICSVDAVVCNPPYGQPSASLASPYESKAVARNQNKDTLDQFLTGAFKILKGKGSLYLVYPAAQMLYLMRCLQDHHLEPKRFQLVYPFLHKAANLVLIEATKDARPTLHPMPPLVIYQDDCSLTNELKSVYHI